MVKALVAHGLVDAQFDLLPSAIGSWRQLYTVTARPTPEERAA
jgi:hypothetical protein